MMIMTALADSRPVPARTAPAVSYTGYRVAGVGEAACMAAAWHGMALTPL